MAFDAANVLISAATNAFGGRAAVDASVRDRLVDRIQQTEHDGVTGPVRFDAFGDDREPLLTVFEVNGGKWVPLGVEPLDADKR